VVATNPCVEIDLPKAVEREVTPLTVDQVEAVADAIGLRYRSLVIVGAGAGLRRLCIKEALGLPLSWTTFGVRSESHNRS
jgi:hypothetical protein